MITLDNLEKSYTDSNGDKVKILNIEKLSIEKGEQIALIGPSGSGKSTLLHIIGAVMEADKGQVLVNEKNIQDYSTKEKDAFRAQYIGYIFQDFHLIPSLTAEENVRLALDYKALSKDKEVTKQIDTWFQRVGLPNKKHAYPHELSRGQQQRVALIRALIHQPLLVLADEPTGSLDHETGIHIMHLLRELCTANDMTLLCVTHDLSLAESFPKTVQMQDINMFIHKGVQTSCRS